MNKSTIIWAAVSAAALGVVVALLLAPAARPSAGSAGPVAGQPAAPASATAAGAVQTAGKPLFVEFSTST